MSNRLEVGALYFMTGDFTDWLAAVTKQHRTLFPHRVGGMGVRTGKGKRKGLALHRSSHPTGYMSESQYFQVTAQASLSSLRPGTEQLLLTQVIRVKYGAEFGCPEILASFHFLSVLIKYKYSLVCPRNGLKMSDFIEKSIQMFESRH